MTLHFYILINSKTIFISGIINSDKIKKYDHLYLGFMCSFQSKRT